VQAVLCLGAVGDDPCIAALCGALGPDHAFPVRMAALDRLAALGERAVPALAALAADGAAPTMARRNAIRALGRTKAAAATGWIASLMAGPDRLLRMSAYQAAGDLAKGLAAAEDATVRQQGRTLEGLREALREKETDPLVKRMR
jgi:HEAT repeat protein